MGEYEDGGKQSVFNAGVLLTQRIDFLQRAMNAARFNPIAMNEETGTFNYEVMLNAMDSLLNESWAKLTDKEQEKGKRISKIVHDFIKLNPIVTPNKDGGFKVNRLNLDKFMEIIDIYEKTNKVLLDAHSLNSPDSDDDGGL